MEKFLSFWGVKFKDRQLLRWHLLVQIFLSVLVYASWRQLLPSLDREPFGLLPDYFPLFFCFQYLGFWLIYYCFHKLDVLGSRVFAIDLLSLVFFGGVCLFIIIQLYTSIIPLPLTVWGVGFLYSAALVVKSLNLIVHLYSVIDKPQLDKRRSWLIFITALLFFSSYTLWASKRVADGDQTRYLLVTHSLIHDQDLDLRNNYENQDYMLFLPDTDFLMKNAGIVQSDGSIKPGHNVGLSVVLIPGYFLGGKLGAQLEMALLAALLTTLIYFIVRQITQESKLGVALAFLAVFTVPAFSLSNLIYPEIPAAVIVAFITYQGFKKRPSLFLSALGLGLLAWLNVRFIPLLFTLGFYLVVNQFKRRRVSHLIQMILLIIVILLFYVNFNQRLYDFSSPAGPYFSEARAARIDRFQDFTYWPQTIYKGTLKIFDQENGFLFYSPWYIFTVLGIYLFLKERDWKTLALIPSFVFLYPISVGVGGLGTGWSPISRYLVVLVPLMIFFLAKLVKEARSFFGSNFFRFLTLYSLGYTAVFSFIPKFSYPRSVSVIKTVSRLTHIAFYKILPSPYTTPDIKNYLLALGYLLIAGLLNIWVWRRYFRQDEDKLVAGSKKQVIFSIPGVRRFTEYLFAVVLANYLLLLFLDRLYPKLFANYWSLDRFMWVIGIFGAVLVFLGQGAQKEVEARKRGWYLSDYSWIGGLSVLGGAIVFRQTNAVGRFGWVVSVLSAGLIFLLSLLILTEGEEEVT
ncbi:hypothetical protein KJ608_00025 [Patescibacteria group bacterium]|nr:hypothetical protein [Patescibacteria group bacterium]